MADWLLVILGVLLGIMFTAGAFAWYDVIKDWREQHERQ